MRQRPVSRRSRNPLSRTSAERMSSSPPQQAKVVGSISAPAMHEAPAAASESSAAAASSAAPSRSTAVYGDVQASGGGSSSAAAPAATGSCADEPAILISGSEEYDDACAARRQAVLDLHSSVKSYKQLRAMSRKMDQMESAELTVRHKQEMDQLIAQQQRDAQRAAATSKKLRGITRRRQSDFTRMLSAAVVSTMDTVTRLYEKAHPGAGKKAAAQAAIHCGGSVSSLELTSGDEEEPKEEPPAAAAGSAGSKRSIDASEDAERRVQPRHSRAEGSPSAMVPPHTDAPGAAAADSAGASSHAANTVEASDDHVSDSQDTSVSAVY